MLQVCMYNLSWLFAVTDSYKLLLTSPVYVRKDGVILQSKHLLISKGPTTILTPICYVGRWSTTRRRDHTHKPGPAPANITWKMTYLDTTMPFTWRNLNRSCAFSRSLNFSLAVKVSYGTKRGWLPPPGVSKVRKWEMTKYLALPLHFWGNTPALFPLAASPSSPSRRMLWARLTFAL